MRISVLSLTLVFVSLPFGLVSAGEHKIGNGCSITATAPNTASSASDIDCKWHTGDTLSLQCPDGAVHYSYDGSVPDLDHPVIQPGDPYRIRIPRHPGTQRVSTTPIRIRPVSGTVTCHVYRSDS